MRATLGKRFSMRSSRLVPQSYFGTIQLGDRWTTVTSAALTGHLDLVVPLGGVELGAAELIAARELRDLRAAELTGRAYNDVKLLTLTVLESDAPALGFVLPAHVGHLGAKT
jgi:hypothetical protein